MRYLQRRIRYSKKKKKSELKIGILIINALVQDGSIFIKDYVVRKKKWISVGNRSVAKVTDSRNKTVVFGCLSIEGFHKDGVRMFKISKVNVIFEFDIEHIDDNIL